MLQAFLTHVRSRNLLQSTDHYLVACSGGKDSIALVHLLQESKIDFEIAHVNFQLRGKESDLDQKFVKNWAENHQITFHTCNASTLELAESKGISIQMAAREIRYRFFEEIRAKRGLNGIILAHHEDDQLETLLLNLTRGTGLDGLVGMAERSGWLIRPLLPFSKSQLEAYLFENQIQWREDQSNAEVYYKRNFLRHQVIPTLLESEPNARENILHSIDRFRETSKAFNSLVEDWVERNISEQKGNFHLPFKAIKNQAGAATLLFYWLRSYGFNSAQTSEIASSLTDFRTGAIFHSMEYELVFDRESLILGKKPVEFPPILIDRNSKMLSTPQGIYHMREENWPAPLDTAREHAMLDLEVLEFPLTVRVWQEGDRFNPLGMTSSKKISDFLIDQKVPLIQKDHVLVMESAGKIAWVVGFRIADWAKCTASTRICLHFLKS